MINKAMRTAAYALVLLSLSCFATESSQVNDEEKSTFHWEFDLGIVAFHHQSLVESLVKKNEEINIAILASGGMYFENFFLEVAPLSGRPLTLGYNLYKKETRQFNLIAESIFFEISEEKQKRGNVLDGISRRRDSMEVGIEYFGILKKYDFRVKLLHDGMSIHHGTIASIELSRPIFTRHVMFVPGISVVYIDQNAADYYFGVSPLEQTSVRPSYRADGAWVATARLYLERPMSDDWSIIGSASYTHYSDEISQSPIVNYRDSAYNISVGVLWTF